MTIYEDENLFVGPSKIHGLGLFAKREFKKGEIVSDWNPVRLIPVRELESVTPEERKYVSRYDFDNYALVGVPSRYINHANSANTMAVEGQDIATRDIAAGEEVTANYDQEEGLKDF